MTTPHLTRSPISLEEFLGAPGSACGATAVFVGTVRDNHQGRAVIGLEYEGYVPMAEKQMRAILAEAGARWSLLEARAVHRLGSLKVGEAAVAVVVRSGHRAEAFEACRFVIEAIKARVPVWKKESYSDGGSEWVGCAHAEVAC